MNDELYRWNSSNGTGIYTPINITIGQNQAQSIMDFYYYNNKSHGLGVAGNTDYVLGDRPVSFVYSNFSCATINAWGNVYNSLSNSKKIQFWAHETGHAMGLAHNDDLSYISVMRSSLYSNDYRNYDGPTANDLAGINHLYR
ncbi:M12 family metallo-peptidase [Bombilactobacillus bombi]|uniref:M12 family metallo-peptidase n=1 Tax=Bombilactobacillus bombi TaxID=1303590 RepID=UPI0038F64FBD